MMRFITNDDVVDCYDDESGSHDEDHDDDGNGDYIIGLRR